MNFLYGVRNGLAISLILWLMLFCGVCLAEDFTVTVSAEDLPYVQERASEEKMTVPQLLSAVVKGVANGQIAKKYQNEVLTKKTVADMKAEIAAIGK